MLYELIRKISRMLYKKKKKKARIYDHIYAYMIRLRLTSHFF